jgi:hypothetical protein
MPKSTLNSSDTIYGVNENGISKNQLSINAENHLQVSIRDPVSGFGEILTTKLTPRIQIDAVYGLLTSDTESITATGGSVSVSNNMFQCQTGTSIGGYGVLRSRRLITYRPGQAIRTRFTAMFTQGVANSIQFGGLFSATNGYFVGYNGSQFGVWRRNPGRTAIYRLTITVGTGGNETHTVTLNSVAFTVNTTGVLTTNRVAEEIAENISATGWSSIVSPKSNGATVTFIQALPALTSGSFTYSSTGTATGTISQLQSGLANDDTTYFTPQSQFNYDVLDGTKSKLNPSGELLDPTKINVYEIVIPYLGAGSIRFLRMDSEGHFELFHVIEYTNNFTIPSQSNPSYKIGWTSASLGSTTNLTVSGASGAGFIEGEIYSLRYPFSFSASLSAGATEYVIFNLRNRGEFANTNNQRQANLLNISAGLDTSNRVCTINLYLNPTLTGITDWQYVNQSLSCIECSTPSTLAPSSGILIQSFIIASSPLVINLETLQARLTPGDVLSISAKTLSGSAGVVASINWSE